MERLPTSSDLAGWFEQREGPPAWDLWVGRHVWVGKGNRSWLDGALRRPELPWNWAPLPPTNGGRVSTLLP